MISSERNRPPAISGNLFTGMHILTIPVLGGGKDEMSYYRLNAERTSSRVGIELCAPCRVTVSAAAELA